MKLNHDTLLNSFFFALITLVILLLITFLTAVAGPAILIATTVFLCLWAGIYYFLTNYG